MTGRSAFYVAMGLAGDAADRGEHNDPSSGMGLHPDDKLSFQTAIRHFSHV